MEFMVHTDGITDLDGGRLPSEIGGEKSNLVKFIGQWDKFDPGTILTNVTGAILVKELGGKGGGVG